MRGRRRASLLRCSLTFLTIPGVANYLAGDPRLHVGRVGFPRDLSQRIPVETLTASRAVVIRRSRYCSLPVPEWLLQPLALTHGGDAPGVPTLGYPNHSTERLILAWEPWQPRRVTEGDCVTVSFRPESQ